MMRTDKSIAGIGLFLCLCILNLPRQILRRTPTPNTTQAEYLFPYSLPFLVALDGCVLDISDAPSSDMHLSSFTHPRYQDSSYWGPNPISHSSTILFPHVIPSLVTGSSHCFVLLGQVSPLLCPSSVLLSIPNSGQVIQVVMKTLGMPCSAILLVLGVYTPQYVGFLATMFPSHRATTDHTPSTDKNSHPLPPPKNSELPILPTLKKSPISYPPSRRG